MGICHVYKNQKTKHAQNGVKRIKGVYGVSRLFPMFRHDSMFQVLFKRDRPLYQSIKNVPSHFGTGWHSDRILSLRILNSTTNSTSRINLILNVKPS